MDAETLEMLSVKVARLADDNYDCEPFSWIELVDTAVEMITEYPGFKPGDWARMTWNALEVDREE